MKQHIAKKQWKEITTSQQNTLLKWLLEHKLGVSYFNVLFGDASGLNIGQLIAFLGDELCRMKHEIYNDDEYKLQMEVFNAKWTWIVMMYDRTFLKEELCDALWEAVKDKLKR